jgi:hypothetical protein
MMDLKGAVAAELAKVDAEALKEARAEIAEMRKVIRLGRTAVRDLQSRTHGQFPHAAEDFMKESEKWK